MIPPYALLIDSIKGGLKVFETAIICIIIIITIMTIIMQTLNVIGSVVATSYCGNLMQLSIYLPPAYHPYLQ